MTLPSTTYAQRALRAAISLNGKQYMSFHVGPYHWDCSGLVAWAFTNVDTRFNLVTPNNWNNDGENGDMGANGGPDGQFYYFLAHGAVERQGADPVGAAQPGDLIFCWASSIGFQRGFTHIAFLAQPGISFGANSPQLGVGYIAIQGFWSDDGTPHGHGPGFTRALDMSKVHP